MLNRILNRIKIIHTVNGVNFEDEINIPIEEALSRINKIDNRLTPDKAIGSLDDAYFSGVFQDELGIKDLFAVEMYGYNDIPVDKCLRNFIGVIATKIDYTIKDGGYNISLNHNGEYEEVYQADESLSKAIKLYENVVSFQAGLTLTYKGRNFAEAIQKIAA